MENNDFTTVSTTTMGTLLERSLYPFYCINDKGHQAEHFAAVETLGLEINEGLGLGVKPQLITLVAWTHDLFAWSRKNHHLLSELWVNTTDHTLIANLDPVDRDLVAGACRCHRASYEGVFPSVLSALMSAADRGHPSALRGEVKRAWDYSMFHLGLTEEAGLMKAVHHQQEKYGRYGYAKLPNLYLTYFEDELNAKYDEIDRIQSLTYSEIRAWLEEDHVR